ncbi:uncharacterized protein G2W53_008613 [Senna tora]|uniref:Uncharacterized protein n=1 Tax=Senna tora TaxID=362788 RepID=A0A835CES6_9FABA|nr:uncharacterized protein G2W53_008613 [Senna tora]
MRRNCKIRIYNTRNWRRRSHPGAGNLQIQCYPGAGGVVDGVPFENFSKNPATDFASGRSGVRVGATRSAAERQRRIRFLAAAGGGGAGEEGVEHIGKYLLLYLVAVTGDDVAEGSCGTVEAVVVAGGRRHDG